MSSEVNNKQFSNWNQGFFKNQDTMGEVMQSERTNFKVYQFGVSGASISQYIQMLKYTKKEFSPQHYVLVIVGNDFDESLCKYKIKRLSTFRIISKIPA